MQTGSVTTPFGRRPMTLALVRRQAATAEIAPGKTADKWKVFRDVAAAMAVLGIHSNSVAVLDALLTFHPNNDLCQDDSLIVFPSNAQLALRAHGMSGAALRRHLAVLVEAGLIVRKDSPNGKRYARKDHDGEIETAFGFDLAPLLARSEELALMAQKVAADRAALRKAKVSLSRYRRDVRKLITAAMEEGAPGDWFAIEAIYVEIVSRIPRIQTLATTAPLLDEIRMLHEEVVNRLEIHKKTENKSGNGAQIEQHIQNSNTESTYELEPISRKSGGNAAPKQHPQERADESLIFGCRAEGMPDSDRLRARRSCFELARLDDGRSHGPVYAWYQSPRLPRCLRGLGAREGCLFCRVFWSGPRLSILRAPTSAI